MARITRIRSGTIRVIRAIIRVSVCAHPACSCILPPSHTGLEAYGRRSDLNLRAGPPAVRPGVASGLAQGRRRAGRMPRPGGAGVRARGDRSCRPGGDLRADAHRHAPGGHGHLAGTRGQSDRAHLLLRAVRAAERAVPAPARRRDDPGRRVRERAGGAVPTPIGGASRKPQVARRHRQCDLRPATRDLRPD